MIGLEIFNTFILLLLVVAAVTFFVGKGFTGIGRCFWGLQFSDVPALGGDGSGGCGLYRGNGGCGDKYRGIGSHYFSFKEKIKRLMKFFSLIPVIAIGGLLIWAAQDFPQWGDDESPASKSPVSSHFIGNTGVDTEVPKYGDGSASRLSWF